MVYLGIGSNIDAINNIANAKIAILDAFDSVEFSRTFQSEAVGFKGDDFLNLVAKVESDASLDVLVEQIKNLETKLGRVRGSEKFSSRSIDIDILLYGQLICHQPIELPRDEILHNAYVLWPLAELSPDLRVPGEAVTYLDKWQAFDKNKQRLAPTTAV